MGDGLWEGGHGAETSRGGNRTSKVESPVRDASTVSPQSFVSSVVREGDEYLILTQLMDQP